MKVVWIAGKCIEVTDVGIVWEIAGIFDREDDAINVCLDEDYFVGPIEINVQLPECILKWPKPYYPHLEEAKNE